MPEELPVGTDLIRIEGLRPRLMPVHPSWKLNIVGTDLIRD
jgi:hypothetical protein